MLAPIVHILPLTIIQKRRILPMPGRVVVRKGQKVDPKDVIAEANLEPEHTLLNIARGLGVSIEQADELIQCAVDDDVNEGDLIAGPVGLTRRVVRAPVNGRIVLVGDGQVLIQADKPSFELLAGVSGTVTELVPDYGAVIETTGALIQGVWGNDRADFGLMQSKLEEPDDVLSENLLDMSLRGAIILGGHCADPKVLQKAADIPIKGLILTSMSASLVPLAKKIAYPILVLEGFGRIRLNSISYNLLTTHQNHEVSINAESLNPYTDQRPEVSIPLPASRELDLPVVVEEFRQGQSVRIVRAPYQGRTGTIDLLYNGLVEFPSGIRTAGAKVSLEEGETVRVPLLNLEIVT